MLLIIFIDLLFLYNLYLSIYLFVFLIVRLSLLWPSNHGQEPQCKRNKNNWQLGMGERLEFGAKTFDGGLISIRLCPCWPFFHGQEGKDRQHRPLALMQSETLRLSTLTQ